MQDQITPQEQRELDEYLSDPFWPEPANIAAIFKKKALIKEDQIDDLDRVLPERKVRLDVDPMIELLGENTKDVYEQAVKHFRAKWKGISFADLKQEMLIKAYEIKERPQAYVYKSLRNVGMDFIRSEIRHSARFIPAGHYFNDEHLEATNDSVKDAEDNKAGDMMKDNYVNPNSTRFDLTPSADRATPISNPDVLKSFLIIYALDPLALSNDNRIVVGGIFNSLPPHFQSSITSIALGKSTAKDRVYMSRLIEKVGEGLYI